MQDLTNIRAILWDLDGTLQDSYGLILSSMQHATRTVLGRTFPDDFLMQKVGQPLSVQMWDFTDDQATHDELVRVYREHNEAVHDQNLREFPGMREALERLQAAGYKMGVVTSKRHELAQQGLDVTGCAPYMDFVVGPDDCPGHKPDPAPVVYGCKLAGFAPENCMYVGDSPFDMAAGNGAGCTTVAALWGMFLRDVMEAEHPDYLCENVADLVALLGA